MIVHDIPQQPYDEVSQIIPIAAAVEEEDNNEEVPKEPPKKANKWKRSWFQEVVMPKLFSTIPQPLEIL